MWHIRKTFLNLLRGTADPLLKRMNGCFHGSVLRRVIVIADKRFDVIHPLRGIKTRRRRHIGRQSNDELPENLGALRTVSVPRLDVVTGDVERV